MELVSDSRISKQLVQILWLGDIKQSRSAANRSIDLWNFRLDGRLRRAVWCAIGYWLSHCQSIVSLSSTVENRNSARQIAEKFFNQCILAAQYKADPAEVKDWWDCSKLRAEGNNWKLRALANPMDPHPAQKAIREAAFSAKGSVLDRERAWLAQVCEALETDAYFNNSHCNSLADEIYE